MNWEAIGAIGEMVGALAVVVTLGFLAFQMNQNTKALRAEAYRTALEMIHIPTSYIIQNAELADIFVRGNESYTSLPPADQVRYHYLMVQRLHAIDNLEGYERAGVTDSSLSVAAKRIIERAAINPGFLEWWAARGVHIYSAQFCAEVQALIDSIDA